MQDTELRKILTEAKTIAVVGFSPQAHKPSFFVAKYLQVQGYRVLPINPAIDGAPSGLLGEPGYADLATAQEKTGLKIDIVDVFRRSEHTPAVCAQAISVGAGCVWLQLGIANDEVFQKGQQSNTTVVMDKCLKTEHQRLMLKA
ncbi:MAG: CoA-binding protein [Limnobacter sp.]|nr:CoA-binding protein [Limnobacter sp.]